MLVGVNTPEGAPWRSSRERGAPSPQQQPGCREGWWLRWEEHCGVVGGPGAGLGWALKVGAHWLRAAAQPAHPGTSSAAAAPCALPQRTP